MAEEPWYSELRAAWKPESVRLLLIGESAPASSAEQRRFFYAPELTQHDNLFRGVVAALYGPIPGGMTGTPKKPWLERLKADGVFLVDLVPYPCNQLSSNQREARRLRKLAHREHAANCVAAAAALEPAAIIVCHAPSFRALAPLMHETEMPLLHEEPIPFPLGNTRRQFCAGVGKALAEYPGGWRLLSN